jgi:hypothetical protein
MALALALAGCGPKPLPEWAMNRHVEQVTVTRTKATGIIEPAPRRAPPSRVTLTHPQAEVLPFSPEWQAREDTFDSNLRRTMNICRGC